LHALEGMVVGSKYGGRSVDKMMKNGAKRLDPCTFVQGLPWGLFLLLLSRMFCLLMTMDEIDKGLALKCLGIQSSVIPEASLAGYMTVIDHFTLLSTILHCYLLLSTLFTIVHSPL
jgi:hypothetical protein